MCEGSLYNVLQKKRVRQLSQQAEGKVVGRLSEMWIVIVV